MWIAFTAACLAALCMGNAAQVSPTDGMYDYKSEDGATLTCQLVSANMENVNMKWYKNGVEISEDPLRYEMSTSGDDMNEYNLRILHPMQDDVGQYTCNFTISGDGTTKETFGQVVSLKSPAYVNGFESTSKNLVQGDPLVLKCDAWGYPLPEVQWQVEYDDAPEGAAEGFVPLDLSDERIVISTDPDSNIVNGSLRINDLDYEDRAKYMCIASNGVGNSSDATIQLRVKDKLAALWPFLGICAEVIILCIIIFVYEHRRAKKMADEDAPEEAGHLTNSNDHKNKDDVRHRK